MPCNEMSCNERAGGDKLAVHVGWSPSNGCRRKALTLQVGAAGGGSGSAAGAKRDL